jgi:hypothetical protein
MPLPRDRLAGRLAGGTGQGVSSPGVRGSLPPEKALERLLVGTNLSYRKLGNNNVVLEKRSTSGTLNLQQVTISATRQAQSVNSVPSTVTVQTREELDRNNVNTIKELVRYEPGVAVGGTGSAAVSAATTFAASTVTASSPRSTASKYRTASSTARTPRPSATTSTRKSSSASKSSAVRPRCSTAATPSAAPSATSPSTRTTSSSPARTSVPG